MVIQLPRLLSANLAGRALVSVQNPVRLDDGSEPQPDAAVLQPRADDDATATPRPADVPLLIEVADSSLKEDRETKAPLYAESGIAEYWTVNLLDYVGKVHRRPGCLHGDPRRPDAGEPAQPVGHLRGAPPARAGGDRAARGGATLAAMNVMTLSGSPTRG